MKTEDKPVSSYTITKEGKYWTFSGDAANERFDLPEGIVMIFTGSPNFFQCWFIAHGYDTPENPRFLFTNCKIVNIKECFFGATEPKAIASVEDIINGR